MNGTNPNQPPRKRRGCFFYGCLTLCVIFVLFCVMAFLTYRWARGLVYEYTDSSPMALPQVEMSDEEFQSLSNRVKTFSEAVNRGQSAEPLVLTGPEINALLAKSPEAGQWGDKLRVTLEGDQVHGLVSIPLRGIARFATDRYLNGEATFKVSLEKGELVVNAQDIKVKGKALPESLMKGLRRENLAKDADRNPKNAEALSKLESIQVHDSKVTITPRAGN